MGICIPILHLNWEQNTICLEDTPSFVYKFSLKILLITYLVYLFRNETFVPVALDISNDTKHAL